MGTQLSSESAAKLESDRPALVVSVPKSGTHIVVQLVLQLGFEDARLLIREKYIRRRGATQEMPVRKSVRLVSLGSVAHAHLRCTPRIVEFTGHFRRIFVWRDLRECLVSRFRHVCAQNAPMAENWSCRPGRDFEQFLDRRGVHEIEYSKGMLEWRDVPDVLVLGHEQIRRGAERFPATICEVASHLGVPSPDDPAALAEWWDERAERWFRRHGGDEVNRALDRAVDP